MTAETFGVRCGWGERNEYAFGSRASECRQCDLLNRFYDTRGLAERAGKANVCSPWSIFDGMGPVEHSSAIEWQPVIYALFISACCPTFLRERQLGGDVHKLSSNTVANAVPQHTGERGSLYSTGRCGAHYANDCYIKLLHIFASSGLCGA